MKLMIAGVVASLAVLLAGCASGYSHWGVAPDDAVGMTQADSACDAGRGSDDMGSTCYVSRRPWTPPSDK